MEEWLYSDVPSTIGLFRIVYRDRTVRSVDLLERGVSQTGLPEGVRLRRPPFPSESPPKQLAEYFKGQRTAFDLTTDPITGSDFDRAVWKTLEKVPAGATVTYGELARRTGHAGSARAVGGSMRRNPIPVVIPCHRVVGQAGDLTGYGLGLWRKRWLLDHEGAWPLRYRSLEGPRGKSQRTLEESGPYAEASARPASPPRAAPTGAAP